MATLDAFGLVASDLSRTLQFYRLLGLEFPDGAESEPHVEAQLGGGVRLMIDPLSTIQSFEPDFKLVNGASPAVSLAFNCGSPENVDATYKAATDAGFDGHREPWDAFWGQRYGQLRDPDGNGVDLYAALPESS
jgi:uncharacterized glyoxalase superfamily protein PhnB